LEEVTVLAGQNVSTDIDDNIELIVDNPQGILGQQLLPQPMHYLNITLITIFIIKFSIFSNYS
jgi:hypothetical protein